MILKEAMRRHQKYHPPYRLKVVKHRTINSKALYQAMAMRQATTVRSANRSWAERSAMLKLLPGMSASDMRTSLVEAAVLRNYKIDMAPEQGRQEKDM